MQLGLPIELPKFTANSVRSDWRPAPVNQLPLWRDARRVAFDIETRDDTLTTLGPGVRRGGYIVGFSFAIEDGPAHYVPVRHDGGDNVDEDQAFRYLGDQLTSFTGEVCGAGLSYDLDFVWERCGERVTDNVKGFRDCLVAEPIIDQLQNNYNLEAVLARHGLPGKDEALMRQACAEYRIDPKDVKKHLWRFPARYVGPYGEADARRPLALLDRQERLMAQLELWHIWDLESQVLPILVLMRRRGVRVNMRKVEEIERWTEQVELECCAEIEHLTGIHIGLNEINKNVLVARACVQAGYRLPMTEPTKAHPNGQPSTANSVLKKCGRVGLAAKRAKEFNKLRNTFCFQVRKYQVRGRIHATTRQLKGAKDNDDKSDEDEKGTRWGRCSSIDPNMQYQPSRNDEYGARWRDIYESDDPDEPWVCSDWSQQEPRWAVHFAEKLGLPGAKDFADEYRRNPALDVHQALTDIIGDPDNFPRKQVKNTVSGRIYGMGDVKLCYSCDWPLVPGVDKHGQPCMKPADESLAHIKKFDDMVPWMRMLTRAAAKVAERRGYVLTAYKRRCAFPPKGDGKYDWAHKAFSRVGQGSAADEMKLALVACHRAGVPLQLTVHDEFDWVGRKWAKIVRDIQLSVLPRNVPHQVDTEMGPTWGTGKKMMLLGDGVTWIEKPKEDKK